MRCSKCGAFSWVEQGKLRSGVGCKICGWTQVQAGINDITTLRPDIASLFLRPEEANLYRVNSNKHVDMVCPNCNSILRKTPNSVANKGFICPNCSDRISYPEKFFASFLSQQGVTFYRHVSKRSLYWADKYIYDFYIPTYGLIVETHGIQHYDSLNMFGMTSEQQAKIDANKRELALRNGIAVYVELDCRYSNMSYIRDSIQQSELMQIFSNNMVDYSMCAIQASSSLLPLVCADYEADHRISFKELGNKYGLSKKAIRRLLDSGTSAGLCKYDGNERMTYEFRNDENKHRKAVSVFNADGVMLGTYQSVTELVNVSEKEFGIHFNRQNICSVCHGRRKHSHGYTFQFVDQH